MAKEPEPVTIKKYANRRLYNTGTSAYVTLEDLAQMVKNGEDFVVSDAKTGEDITRAVLTQIIVEQESKGPNLLPATFLRQLIRFYGDSLQTLVPTYLDFSLDALKRDQAKLQSQMAQMLGGNPFGALEEQVRRNTELFQQAMRMFLPGAPREASPEPAEERPTGGASSSDVEALRRQLDSMQAQLNKLADKA